MLSLAQARYARKLALKAVNTKQQPVTYWQAQFAAANRILSDFKKFGGDYKPPEPGWKEMNIRRPHYEAL